MGKQQCAYHWPEGHPRAGERCGVTILPEGKDMCIQHLDPGHLERARKNAKAKRRNKELRKPSHPAWKPEGWYLLDRPAPEWAERAGISEQEAYKNYAWQRAKDADDAAAEVWVPPRPEGIPESHFDLEESHIPTLIDGFLQFRGKYFKDERRRPYKTPPFQQKWASKIIESLVTGGKQVVLAPQRHGKSQLLAHLSAYLICLYPNIRILWVSVAQGIAANFVNQVSRILAGNEDLIEAYAGPGGTFRPSLKDGQSWSKGEFTVATRTAYDIVGASMQSIGRGGSLVSLNADVVVVDDCEDTGSVAQAGTRQATREWFSQELEARKEEHTGLFVIGSRRSPDDLYGHLIDNDQYDVIVEQAHDDACPLDEYDYDAHTGSQDDGGCLLFPELRSYRWLMKQKLSSETTGGEASWRMIYQNQVSGDGLAVFDKEAVLACRSKGYTVGTFPTVRENGVDPNGSGVRLVAGLDPSHVGYQAAVLFAYQTAPDLKIWLLDLENREGGGVPAAERTIRRWYEEYKVSHWVIESNLLGSLDQYKEIRDYTRPHGIRLQSFGTYSNKADPFYGITSLAPLFKNQTFILPYGDAESVEKTDTFTRQLVVWDGSQSRNRNARAGQKDDCVMASWFAFDPIRRSRQEFNAEMGVELEGGYEGFGFSDVPWDTPFDDKPW